MFPCHRKPLSRSNSINHISSSKQPGSNSISVLKSENRLYRKRCLYWEGKFEAAKKKIHLLRAMAECNHIEERLTFKNMINGFRQLVQREYATLNTLRSAMDCSLKNILEAIDCLETQMLYSDDGDTGNHPRMNASEKEKWRREALERIRNFYQYACDFDLSAVEEREESRYLFENGLLREFSRIPMNRRYTAPPCISSGVREPCSGSISSSSPFQSVADSARTQADEDDGDERASQDDSQHEADSSPVPVLIPSNRIRETRIFNSPFPISGMNDMESPTSFRSPSLVQVTPIQAECMPIKPRVVARIRDSRATGFSHLEHEQAMSFDSNPACEQPETSVERADSTSSRDLSEIKIPRKGRKTKKKESNQRIDDSSLKASSRSRSTYTNTLETTVKTSPISAKRNGSKSTNKSSASLESSPISPRKKGSKAIGEDSVRNESSPRSIRKKGSKATKKGSASVERSSEKQSSNQAESASTIADTVKKRRRGNPGKSFKVTQPTSKPASSRKTTTKVKSVG